MRKKSISIREMAAAAQLKEEKEYWLNKLSGTLERCSFPYDQENTGKKENKEITFDISVQLLSALLKVSKNSDKKLYMILTAGLILLLVKYTGNHDIILGAPIYKQQREGDFINTALALRNNVNTSQTFKDLLLQVKQTISEALKHQNYPIEALADELDIPYGETGFPLFDVVILLKNIHNESYIQHLKTNLLFSFQRTTGDISGISRYNGLLYRDDTIKAITRHFTHLLGQALSNGDLPLAYLEILPGEEKRRILFDFNNTEAHYPGDKTVHRLFAEQGERTPDRLAIVGPGCSRPVLTNAAGDSDTRVLAACREQTEVTYKAVNEMSDRLARLLKANGVKADTMVGIMVTRSIEMIVGVLAILKAGGAYLSIADDYPETRIEFMLEDSAVNVLLTTGKNMGVGKKINFNGKIIYLEDGQTNTDTRPADWEFHYFRHPQPVHAASLAYVIYTSGSTGRPKGVMVDHRSVVRLVKNNNFIKWEKNDRLLQTSVMEFDVSTFEVWDPLLNGLSLFLANKDIVVSAEKLKETIEKNGITVIWMTSPLFNQMLDTDIEVFHGLTHLLVGGDVVSPSHVNRLRKRFPALKVTNGYGPSENTTFSTTFLVDREYKDNIPIGKPIANSTAFILDKDKNMQPMGVPGELWVGGDGLSRGYLNNPELTAEKFVDFSKQAARFPSGKKNNYLYRTGDFTRWLWDGNIEFLGRVDHQVKIRGFRIELEEIRNQLLAHHKVKDALVITRQTQNQDKDLCCYWVPVYPLSEKEDAYHAAEIKEYLCDRLPGYMIPGYFIEIDKIPLTPNGKVDRKALPKVAAATGKNYTAPRNELEKKLVHLWSDLLNVDSPDSIGIDDNFFELGGHSLKATIFLSRLHRLFNIKIVMSELFKTPTIRGVAERVKHFTSSGTGDRFSSVKPVEQKEYYPLSSAQKRLYVLHRMDVSSTGYNMPQISPLQEKPDLEKMEKTLKKLIKRHESLRTSVHLVNDQPVQKIHEEVEFKIERSVHGAHNGMVNFVRPFDLSRAPLLRAAVQETREHTYLLLVDLHHIISDAVSHQVLLRDYLMLCADLELPPLRLHYKDYARWQNSTKQQQAIRQQEAYWLEEFPGDIPLIDLPVDYQRPRVQSFEGRSVDFDLGARETDALRQVGFKREATPYMVLLALYFVLLSKISSQEDIIVGSPAAGRGHEDLEQIIGMFVNTLALRNFPRGRKTLSQFITDVKERTLKAFENQDYQFEDLVEKLAVNRDISRNPLFDVMFAFQTLDRDWEVEKISRLHREPAAPDPEHIDYYEDKSAKFDLSLNAIDAGQKFIFSLHYSTKLFKQETVQRIINYFRKVVDAVLENPGQFISQVEIFPEEEKQRLVRHFNRTDAKYPANQTIHELVEDRADKSGDSVAVVCEGLGPGGRASYLTYGELNRRAGQLARRLRDKGIGSGDIAAVLLKPSLDMAVAILAVLKSGAGYLPIDPENPGERIAYMLKDSEARVLLSDLSEVSKMSKVSEGTEVLDLSLPPAPRPLSPASPASPLNLSYVIYTSGTTGKPKGVMVTHGNLVNYVTWFSAAAQLTPEDRSILTASFGFDLGYTSFYPPLLQGGQVHLLAKEAYMLAENLLDYISLRGISYLKMTPSFFSTVVKAPNFSRDTCRQLKLVVLGGEPIDAADVETAHQVCEHIKIMNHYGPTEVTIGCIARFIDFDGFAAYKRRPTIGRPIFNTRVFILDNYLKLLPVGVAGELCLCGDGVGRGYLNRPELTEQRFFYNRSYKSYRSYRFNFSKKLYRTGDRARWLADDGANIEFLGRIDQQVKIRGYRIELGEIESELTNRKEIKEAVVLARGNASGQKYLCAYIVPAAADLSGSFQALELKNLLSRSLPDYMVPSYFVPLEKLPLTPNGKLNRSALPEPRFVSSSGYVAPRDSLEEKLLGIWMEILGKESLPGSSLGASIGIRDDFFELGGNSLSAIAVFSKIHKEFDVKIPLVEMFKEPTIAGLAAYIKESAKDKYVSIEPVEEKESYLLSSAQKRMYILQQMDPESTAYNMPRVIRLPGDLDIERLAETFGKVVKRQESMRTSYQMVDSRPVQVVHQDVQFRVEHFDLSRGQYDEADIDDIVKEFVRPFDLAMPPLFRAALLKTWEQDYLLILDTHHIISDGASHRIIQQEFASLYLGEELPVPALRYRDYSEWQNRLYRSQEIKRQETYWLKQFEGEIPVITMPYDFPRPSVKSYAGSSSSFKLSKEKTAAVQRMARDEGATLYMAVLAIYNVFLAKLSRQEEIIVGSAVAGRKHADLEGIVGMFVNTLALRNYPGRNKTFKSFLKEVKNSSLQAFENQDYQFEDLVELVAANAKRDASRNPLFDASFAFQDTRTGTGPGKTAPANTAMKPKQYRIEINVTKFDLTLNGSVEDGETFFTFIYSKKLFKEKTINLFAAWFNNLVDQVLSSPDSPLHAYHLSTGREIELYNYLDQSVQEIECIYPATPTQRDIYLDCRINPGARAHRMIYYYLVRASIDTTSWQESLTVVHRLYPIIRASLASSEDKIYLAIKRRAEIDFHFIDLTEEKLREDQIDTRIRQLTQSSTHGLDQGLITHYLIKISADMFIDMLSIHHIIFDGPSLKIFFEKFHEIYRKIREGRLDDFDYRGQIKDHRVYIHFQQSTAERFDTRVIEEHWKQRLANVEKLHRIGTPGPNRFVSRQLSIPPHHLEEISACCKPLNISLPLYLRGLYALLIHFHYSVKQDLLIREIFGGRDETTRDFVGCFFHTIPLVFTGNMFDKDRTTAKYFQDIFALIMRMRGKQDISILLQNRLLGEEEMTFYFNYRNFLTLETSEGYYYLNRVLEYSDPDFHPGEVQLITKNVEEGFFLELDYNESYFNGERFLERLLHLSRQVTAGTGRLADLNFLMEDELNEILACCSGRTAEFPSETPLFRLFRQRAEKEPDKIAAVCEDRQITYGSLNITADRLARYLKDTYAIQTDQLVSIIMDRSLAMMASILAVWKAGGAYIPIDYRYPGQRILEILHDAEARAVISYSRYIPGELADAWDVSIIKWDDFSNHVQEQCTADCDTHIDMGSLAYVIYTSGSTGKPKGVMVEHIGMMNHIQAKIDDLRINSQSIVAQNASHTFDISVWQFFVAPAVGGKTVIYPDPLILEPVTFLHHILKDGVTILEVVPSYLSLLLETFMDTGTPHSLFLDYILVTGEAVKPNLVKQWFKLYPGIKMVNAYGPTEASDDITHYIMNEAPGSERIPIGTPLQNLNVYIVDENMKLCPFGVKGEICVSGVGVGRGYLKNEAATRNVFMEDPFSREKGVRLYKTGDLGCWLPDGTIDFFGRKDSQVKIRGFRIELGEIEIKLANHPEVKGAVVIDREIGEIGTGKERGGDKYLCAYVVLEKEIKEDRLKEYLSRELPGYMIPSSFVILEKIPLTPNGKVDRSALPAPEAIDPERAMEYAAPRNDIEGKLVEIWKNVLGRKSIGIHENFFLLGGDSIKAIQIASRMGKAGYKVAVKDIFQFPLISQLGARVTRRSRDVSQAPVTGVLPLTPIQVRFFQKTGIIHHHYNQAMMLYSGKGFEEAAVKAVLTRIQEHHDALRMIFPEEKAKIRQINREPGSPLSFRVFDFRGREDKKEAVKAMESRANQIQASLDLQKGPLMKLALFRLDDGDRLLIVIHHLVIDGVSWRILMEDIDTLYRDYLEKKPLVLPLKTDSYKRWAEKLAQYARSPLFLEEIDYWKKLESTPVTEIKKDVNTMENRLKDTAALSFHLEENETEKLVTKVNNPFGTEINDILLTALGLAVKNVFGHEPVLIALEGHGREELFQDVDITRTVGWFTAVYPVILHISYENDLSRQIKEVKENLRQVPHKGVGYGILKYLTPPKHRRGIDFKLKPQILFNYMGQFDADVGNTSLAVAREWAGHSLSPRGQREYELDISAMTAGKCLVISITYSKKQFKPTTIQSLSDDYKNQLKRIISYCSGKKEKELTPGDLTYKKLTIDELETIDAMLDPQTRGNIKDIYPLSPMQEGMYFHSLLDKSSTAYFQQGAYRLHGEVNINDVQNSLNELLKHHDILRTTFIQSKAGTLLQVVPHNRKIDFYFQDISQKEDKENYLVKYKEKDRQRSFDLGNDVLIRVALFQLDKDLFEFTWSHHHILMDGWCLGILIAEFSEIYISSLENHPYRLHEAKPYREYIRWLAGRDKNESRNYWKEYLNGYEEAAGVPKTHLHQRDIAVYKQELVVYQLEKEKTAQLNQLAAKNHVTLNTIVHGLWGIILGKYNGKQDVVFAAVVSGRPPEIEDVESMVGLFINTIPVRIRFDKDTKFNHLLRHIQEKAVNTEPHHYYPLADIQAESPLKQNLLDHLLVFENYPIAEQIEGVMQQSKEKSSEVAWRLLKVETFERTHYDFNLKINPFERLMIRCDYNENAYNREFVQRILIHFRHLLDQVLRDQTLAIGRLSLVSENEKKQVLYEFNDTHADYGFSGEKTLYRLFEDQAGKTPDRAAVVSGSTPSVHITYRVFNETCKRLSRLLKAKGVKPGTIVAVMVERSIDMVIDIMAVLHAGGAYLPIDPEYPEERKKYILTDSNARVLVGKTGELTMVGEEPEVHDLSLPPASPANPSNLAYIIYTSGSTGKPKGVMVEQISVVNLVLTLQNEYPLTERDTYLLKTSFLFDVSVTELFGWFLPGGRLAILAAGAEKDPQRIMDMVEKALVTHINFVPSMFNVFLDSLTSRSKSKLSTLKYIFLAGEALTPEIVRKFRGFDTGICLENIYGPTEATVYGCNYPLSQWDNSSRVPIGKPLKNMELYILDQWHHLQPVGIVGELVIAGVGLARGYLNRPELTAEKFLSFSKKIYKTGDLARWLEDGNIEFLGRMDHQVKVRGFRVELGEIENRLLQHENVSEAVVIAKEISRGGARGEKGDRSLCAYVVPVRGKSSPSPALLTALLKKHLSHSLPGYMVPSHFVTVDSIPLTPGGKVDRKTLAALDAGISSSQYSPPRSHLQREMADIWQDFFGIPKVGIHDDFFLLGGHSLLAVRLINRFRDAGISISLDNIYKNRTIHRICAHLQENRAVHTAGAIENYLTQKHDNLFYRTYNIDGETYSVLYFLGETLPTREILEDIKKEFTPEYCPNFIKQLNNRDEIIATPTPERDQFAQMMGLKNILGKEEEEMPANLICKSQRFSSLLTKNMVLRQYQVSPGQMRFLVNKESAAKQNLSVSCKLTGPLDMETIKQVIFTLIHEHSLLRSIIVPAERETAAAYLIKEFQSFTDTDTDIEIPIVDISNYSLTCKEEILEKLRLALKAPFEIINNVLYRFLIIKWDNIHFKIEFVLNHLISDGESVRVLQNDVYNILNDLQGKVERPRVTKDYHDFLQFLHRTGYEDIRLEKYLDLKEFEHYSETFAKNLETETYRSDFFEIDLAGMEEGVKDYYTEIILLCYARWLGELGWVDKVPVQFTSNGRNYKDGNFNNIIGLFPHPIPVLFATGDWTPDAALKHFIDYRTFVRDRNIHFFNYFARGCAPHINLANILSNCSLTFNSPVDRYENLKRSAKQPDQARETGIRAAFDMTISKDFYSNQLAIAYGHNSCFENRELKERFREIYYDLEAYFNQRQVIFK